MFDIECCFTKGKNYPLCILVNLLSFLLLLFVRSMKSMKMIMQHLVSPSLFRKTWQMVTSTIREKSTNSGLIRYPSELTK